MKGLWMTFVLVGMVFSSIACQEKSDKTAPSKPLTKNKKSSEMTPEEMLNQINQSSAEKENRDVKAQAKSIGEKSGKWPDDGSWALLIDDRKIPTTRYEQSYKLFVRRSGRKISRKDYVNVFLQNHFITSQANYYFQVNRGNKALLNMIYRQTVIQTYLQQKVYNKRIKNPDSKTLAEFHRQVITQKGYEKLSLRYHKAKLIKLYKSSKMNQEMVNLDQTLKGEYRIAKNDEWEEDIISKYIKNKINMSHAMGKGHKKYWLYKIYSGRKKSSVRKPLFNSQSGIILPGAEEKSANNMSVESKGKSKDSSKALKEKSPSKPFPKRKKAKSKSYKTLKNKTKESAVQHKLSDENATIFYVKDIENKMYLSARIGNNPRLMGQFRKNPRIRMQILNRFLLEELIYLKLKKSKVLYTNYYRIKANLAVNNFKTQYYLKNVLKLHSGERQRNYFMDLISSHKIILSDNYFNKQPVETIKK